MGRKYLLYLGMNLLFELGLSFFFRFSLFCHDGVGVVDDDYIVVGAYVVDHHDYLVISDVDDYCVFFQVSIYLACVYFDVQNVRRFHCGLDCFVRMT